MKKLLLIAMLGVCFSVANMPTLEKVFGFGTSAHAQSMQDDDNQGDNDDQGEDGNGQYN